MRKLTPLSSLKEAQNVRPTPSNFYAALSAPDTSCSIMSGDRNRDQNNSSSTVGNLSLSNTFMRSKGMFNSNFNEKDQYNDRGKTTININCCIN